MDSIQNTAFLNERNQDPALEAALRMEQAGDDDTAYDAAVVALVAANATTIAGALAQHRLLYERHDSLDDGDTLLPAGESELRILRNNIRGALSRLALS